MNRKAASRADTRLIPKSALFALISLILSPLAMAHAATPPADSVHFCAPFDYEQWRRDHPRPAAKQLAALDTGAPRTVRMIYFLPNDRPFRQEVADSIKAMIRQVRTFYADQMQAHGYGNKTFRIETDAQGKPRVHRVNGRHPSSHYFQYDTANEVLAEIDQVFDIEANVYLTVIDSDRYLIAVNGDIAGGVGSRWSKRGGFALVSDNSADFKTVAHELGHGFGLWHDFRDDTYVMSYGFLPDWLSENWRLSACNAQFLAVHTYFNSNSPTGGGSSPTAQQLTSSPIYTAGATSISVRANVQDSDGLHEALLLAQTKEPHPGVGALEVKACRGLEGKREAVVEFDHDGVIPSHMESDFNSFKTQSLSIEAVDALGNIAHTERFELINTRFKPPISTFSVPWGWDIPLVAFSPNGRLLALGPSFSGDAIKLWNVSTGQSILTLPGQGRIETVAFSPNGRLLALDPKKSSDGTTIPYGTIALWDVSNGQHIATIDAHGGGEGISSLSFSPDGRLLASGGRFKKRLVKLWDVSSREHIATLDEDGNLSSVTAVVFSPTGRLLASAQGGSIKLWDVSSREHIATLRVHGSFVHWARDVLSFSPDGRLLASGTERRQGNTAITEVTLWDVSTGQSIATLSGGAPVAFSPDGRLLASASASETRWVDVDGLPGGASQGETSGGEMIKLWDVSTGQSIATLPQLHSVSGLVFSPNGRRLAGWDEYTTVKLWNVSEWAGGQTTTSEESDLADFFDTFFGSGKPAALPDSPQLAQNAPNPFNSQTVLSYFLPEPSLARFEVFTLTGQRVAVLHQGPQQAGYHRLHWDGRDAAGFPVASGAYLYRLVTDDTVLTRKLILLR